MHCCTQVYIILKKTRFLLILHGKRQRKIRCLKRDLNSHLRVSRPPLYEFKSRSRQRIFRCRLQCQINMNLVFHISEDGSEIELKHCASSKTSVKSSQKYFVHLNWTRLATNPSWLDSSIGRAAV